MDFMPLIPFLGVSVPESVVLYYSALTLAGKKGSPLSILALSLLTSLFSYFVRSVSMVFGIHSFLQVIGMVMILNLLFQLSWFTAATVMILASVVLGLAEGVFVPLLARLFSVNLEEIIFNPVLRILFSLPHLLFLLLLTFLVRKQKWRLPLLERLTEGNNGEIKRGKRQTLSQMSLFALYLVQALMLALLNISFYVYYSGVYPSFTLATLVEMSSIVLMVSALATILVAGYLLKVTEREARLQTELRHFREKHKLSLQLQVERHDFYNHHTAMYGYLKVGQYDLAAAYMENLYQTVRHIDSLLKMDPPELAAILNVKQEEAKASGIAFHWRVNTEGSTLPLSPEDLIHLVGNLLDSALDAAKADSSPRVDLTLSSNKLGLALNVSNNGHRISQDDWQNISTAGYTTKDPDRHSGLGLYIIGQIIDRYHGCMELKEPENYQGVEFKIYIPWENSAYGSEREGVSLTSRRS
ncbi:ATP-binding protein [Brevibacillus massiliensis]|uniref:ATP-binding protein n=1 Tax=Brevibacillus massiliensis TaxID=1118054 RepID=UPI0002FE6684|nr:ATP-binding protein [Brevibacillus massiliensis]